MSITVKLAAVATKARSVAVAVVALGALAGAPTAANAIPIEAIFNFVPFGGLSADTGNVTTALTITAGAPLLLSTISLLPGSNNIGLLSGQTITLTDPTPVTLGANFTKTFDTPLGSFLENLIVTSVSVGAGSLGIQATGLITSTNALFDPTPVYYSASYTQNLGPGTQINASYNNSTTPPPPVDSPEPASMALLGAGLLGLGYARRKRS